MSLSRTQLSRESGVSPSTIEKWEAGERVPNFPMLVVLARTLRLPIEELEEAVTHERFTEIMAGGSPGLLIAVRRLLNWDRARAAGVLGVSESTVAAWERGDERVPDVEMAMIAGLIGGYAAQQMERRERVLPFLGPDRRRRRG